MAFSEPVIEDSWYSYVFGKNEETTVSIPAGYPGISDTYVEEESQSQTYYDYLSGAVESTSNTISSGAQTVTTGVVVAGT
eukprot:Pgem_evm1s16046